jgi:hypothetical protein
MYGLSSVAGIVDCEGNVRTVVTELWRFRFHVHKGERIFVVPGLLVSEPVEWELIPFVIASAEQAVADGVWPAKSKRSIGLKESRRLLGRGRIVAKELSRAA